MSDHIPDLTKMIGETPRTDAGLEYDDTTVDGVKEFARQLERELNAANELIVRLQAVVNDPHALWANWLRGSVTLPVGIGDVREYQDRIKRLEGAGDKLTPGAAAALMWSEIEAWHKAKEAKP
jgi:hypothetical protein